MPELPDIEAYRACLRQRLAGCALERARVFSPSILRSVDPPIESLEGLRVRGVERLGKRVVLELDGERFLVLHLLIAGRLRWDEAKPPLAKRPGKIVSAQFLFASGSLSVTEASNEKRATLYVCAGREALSAMDPGGLEPLECSFESYVAALSANSRTLKRALTDPHTLAGIGNAYSDEILHAARLAPTQRTTNLDPQEFRRLFDVTGEILIRFRDRLLAEFAHRFPGPGDITAFRPDFAVHGKFGRPCPVCGSSVQRIVRGQHETNYCPRCQTGGKVLADRSLSRLLGEDWPSRVEDWE